MVSKETYWLARTLFERGEVEVDSINDHVWFFTVRNYSIRINVEKGELSCTCEAGSLWRVGQECKHARACMMVLEKQGVI